MHELSIAASLVELAEEEAASRGARILAIHLKLGPLAGVARDALLGSFEIAVAGTSLEHSRLLIEDTPIVAFCAGCDARRTIPSPMRMRCPECGAPTPDVIEGAELLVTALELET
jgi:hydrogenase nickel incorporation protein HypA/HybF